MNNNYFVMLPNLAALIIERGYRGRSCLLFEATLTD
jgi:hypothetical protein